MTRTTDRAHRYGGPCGSWYDLPHALQSARPVGDAVTQAAAQQEFIDVEANLPDVSHPRLARNLSTPFKFDQRTAANIVGGVQTRLRAVSNNMRLTALFDNTVERFGFHTILEGADADDIFIFDLGALTPVSQRAYAITLLSLLDLQLRPRQDSSNGKSPTSTS